MGKILIIADREGEGIALPRGLELAAELGLECDIVAFVHAPLGQLDLNRKDKSRIRADLLDRRAAELQDSVDKLHRGKHRVKVRAVWEKDVASWVCERAAKTSYAFVVKTGHRTDSLGHTSTDWALLRECPAPVLIVAEKKWRETAPVMAALDLAAASGAKKKLNDAILLQAVTLAQAMEEELAIICAVEVPALLKELDLVDPRSYVAEARVAMASQIKALARRYGLRESAFRVKRGPVEKVIASEAARTRAQIVVMGTVGRKGLRAKLIGNTAERVLAHLKTDVLALKP